MSVIRAITTLAIAASIAGAAYAQQYVFPAKGQSPEQQKKDESDCHAWAVGQTGFDLGRALLELYEAVVDRVGRGIKGAACGIGGRIEPLGRGF